MRVQLAWLLGCLALDCSFSRPWWLSVQDAIKKLTNEELPDFYNMTLERPKDDPDGYDVLYIEAAFKVSTLVVVALRVSLLYGCVCVFRFLARGWSQDLT